VGIQGASTQATCLSLKEAQAINKIWYGMTRDGSAPDPDPALGHARTGSPSAPQGQLWWGLTRGTDLTALAGDQAPFPIASQVVALSLQNPRIAQKGMFTNATGNAEDGWKALKSADLVVANERGLALQGPFSDVNTDSPDLSGVRDLGAKVLSYHGLSDQLIAPQGSLYYFDRLAQHMGGVDKVQSFNRLFFIPGLGHSGLFNQTASIGVNGVATPASAAPLPQPATGRDEMFNALRDWVEKGVAPERIELTAASGNISLPICAHPKKPVLTGANANAASSYVCR
jgi:hypothetical protein